MLKIQVIIGVVSILLLVTVFELIRRKGLKEKYSLIWLLSGIFILILSIFSNLLYIVARIMGMYYLTAIFVISFLFLLLIVLHFSTVISRLPERNKELTHELSIPDFRFRELDKRFGELIGEKDETA